MKLMFNVLDRGNNYEVISINNNEIAFTGIKDGSIEVFSWNVFETVARALNEGKKVLIPKLIDRKLDVNDIIIEEPVDELSLAKQTSIIKAKDIMYSTRIDKTTLIDFYYFTILNNWFADKGFFITEDNREEKYLEIINYASGLEDQEKADQVIGKLEEYLNILDEISEAEGMYSIYKDFVSNIEEAPDVNTIETLYNNFVSNFS